MNIPTITSYDTLRAIAQSRPKLTKTYAVTEEVARANYQDIRRVDWHRMRPMTDDEMMEMAVILDVAAHEISGKEPHVEDKACRKCGRKLTFTDLIHAAASSGQHNKHFLAEALSGRLGYFVTIDGIEDDSHAMKCINCGERDLWQQREPLSAFPTPPPQPCYIFGCGGAPAYAHTIH